MIAVDGLGERAAFHETHGIVRLMIVRAARQFIHGHDSRMLKLAGNARLLEEPRPEARVIHQLRAKFLQCHVPAQSGVPREPHPPHAADRVQAGQ